tara:strand:- start:44 stop:571 length:528 start_codon:yes stop_codon:yes gene_type:complete
MSLDQLQGNTTQNAPTPDMLIGGLGGLRGEIIRRGGPRIPEFPPGLQRPIAMPLPDFNIMPRPPIFGIQPPMQLPQMPDYSDQFEKLGEQLGGFGKQLDALGSFNEQVGGLGKQFEAVNNKLDSLEKGLGSLGNQLASIEQGQPKPQEVQQPQQPSYSPFGFGGLANLFMNMRRF